MAGRVESGPAIGHWAANRLETHFWEGRHVALGWVVDGEIKAAVIYENYNSVSVTAHMVCDGPLSRRFLSAIFDYAYRVCGVLKVILPVAKANTRSVRLVEHMGFQAEATLTDCHPDGDLTLYTLRKADCRFLEGKYAHGQEAAPSSDTARLRRSGDGAGSGQPEQRKPRRRPF